MRAYRYHSVGHGSPPRVEDVPAPEPAAGEVLVRVRCASVNPVDWKIATGHFRFLVRGGRPRTMGSWPASMLVCQSTASVAFWA